MSRSFDIIVWGATGFTGKLVAEYLVKNSTCKFAIAGRSQKKLDQVLNDLKTQSPKSDIKIIIADSDDQESLDKMVVQSKVVISTVGPYAKYGLKLVDACVRLKTDYVDLTGEPHFIRKIIDQYHDLAVKNNVLIVPSCGFDSLPSDLGSFLIANEIKKRGQKVKSIKYTVASMKGGVSGGTISSGIELMNALSYKELYELGTNADYLCPAIKDSKAHASTMPYYDKDFQKYQMPFVMEGANLRYVRRTNHLLGYGNDFYYSETVSTPGLVYTAVGSYAIAALGVAMLFPPVRWAIGKIFPPGSGPSEQDMKNGSFVCKLVGESTQVDNKSLKFNALVKGISDPGYGETSKMISEAALCLSLDRSKLTRGNTGEFEPRKGGVVTAASSMGLVLVDRLRKAGMTWEVSEKFD